VTTAFALSGGGNLGPLQAGTVLALLEAGIEPDVLVGSSVGALNAAFLSTRPGVGGAQTLVEAWEALGRREVFRFSPLDVLAGLAGRRDHLVPAHPLRRLIRRLTEFDRIEDAPVRLAVTATDALTGDAVVLTQGPVEDALAASAAIPGLLPPVEIDGRRLVDGSLSAPCPVLQALALGADEVYMITTDTTPRVRLPRGAVALAMSSASLVTARAGREQREQAMEQAARTGRHVSVVPSAQLAAPGPFDFRHSVALADAAYRRTRQWLEDGGTAPGHQPDQPYAWENTTRLGHAIHRDGVTATIGLARGGVSVPREHPWRSAWQIRS